MALEGQLSDFNLAEILQLISSQQKSGFLNLETQRDMVFVFDKGVVISTRDRRDRNRDPLESFLHAYGFFDADQWKHVEYVRGNSSLDLTEILVSEGLLTDEEIDDVLRSMAQEMTVAGMKLKRGRYHFSPTRETPPGVRHPVRLDVQGLLMEAARRLDEETLLREALPSQALTFGQGSKNLPADTLGPAGRRVMKLALAGLPLGRIIRQGRTESFVVRDLLKTWCDQGILVKQETDEDDGEDPSDDRRKRAWQLKSGLRSLPLTMLMVTLLGLGVWARWFAMPPTAPHPGDELRRAQLREEVIQGARLFRYEDGRWPDTLAELVRRGQLAPATLVTVQELGWMYEHDVDTDRFRLGT